MILKTVEIQGVRCFPQSVRVELAKEGFTIIAGPNGSGKSTLLEAVRRGLRDVHTTTGASDLAPWVPGGPPRIALEFEHGGKNYRLTKQFVSKRMSRLERKEGRTWVSDTEGRQADDAVREMLRFGGKNEAGLLSVLWSAQGELPLESVPGGVQEALRAALGAQMAGSHGASFEKQLRKAFEAGWQPARMQPKKGRLHEIDELLAKAVSAADTSRQLLEEADECGRKAKECSGLAAGLRAELVDLEARRQASEAVMREFEELNTQVDNCEREHKSLAELYSALWYRTEQIRNESVRRDQLRAAVPELLAALDQQRAVESEAKAAAETAAQASIEAALPDAAIEQAEARASMAEAWMEISRGKEALERRLGKLALLAQAGAKLHHELNTLQAPDRTALDKIRAAHDRIRDARVRLEKSELRLEISATGDCRLEVMQGTPPGALALAAGSACTIHGDDGISVSFPGLAGLHFSGPQTDAAKWKAQIATAQGELAELCAAFGSTDVTELSARAEKRADLEREFKAIDASRGELLDGERVDDLSAALEKLAEESARMESVQPEWRLKPPEVAALRAEIAGLRVAREERLGLKQGEAAGESQRHGEKQAERQRAENALTANRSQLQDAERRLRELEGDGKSADQRGQELQDTAGKRDAAGQKLREARLRLSTLPQDAPKNAAEVIARQKDVQFRLSRAEREAVDAEATQRALLARGPYDGFVQAEEDVEHHTRDREREMLRLNSTRRLWEVFEARKARAFEGIAEPVSLRATEILAEIMGRRHAELTLSSDFSETTIRPMAAGRDAEIQEMSGGEREQIALSVRLALAEHLTATERHLVVLDDVLLNTDEQTLGRILNFLERKKEQFQVAILTCHAERYRALRGARKIAFPPATAKVSAA
jgi:chromosome segregation ATPase